MTEKRNGSALARTLALVVLTPVCLLAVWCVVDWFYVHVPGAALRAGGQAVLVLCVPAVLIAHLRILQGRWRGLLAVITTALSCAAAAGLIFLVGVPFHLWIGGRL